MVGTSPRDFPGARVSRAKFRMSSSLVINRMGVSNRSVQPAEPNIESHRGSAEAVPDEIGTGHEQAIRGREVGAVREPPLLSEPDVFLKLLAQSR
jgi:hypothetical protein